MAIIAGLFLRQTTGALSVIQVVEVGNRRAVKIDAIKICRRRLDGLGHLSWWDGIFSGIIAVLSVMV